MNKPETVKKIIEENEEIRHSSKIKMRTHFEINDAAEKDFESTKFAEQQQASRQTTAPGTDDANSRSVSVHRI